MIVQRSGSNLNSNIRNQANELNIRAQQVSEESEDEDEEEELSE